MKRKKILSIFGTRPEVVKMAPVVRELQKHREHLESRVCVTAQHRHMLDQAMQVFGLSADIDLNVMRPGQTLPDLTARVLEEVTKVLREEQPDVVLVQGDTTTVMASALAAFYERVAVGHVEAGLRTADRYNPFPEEINRRFATVISTYHFAPTQTAVNALLAENVPAHTIYLTGNTVVDALLWTASQPPTEATSRLMHHLGLCQPVNSGQPRSKWVLVTAHRRENFGEPFENICRAMLDIVTRNPQVQLIYPVHLNPNVQEPVRRILSSHERIHLIDPLSYEQFVHIMKQVDMVLTDSGGVQEEAPVFGKPVLVLRNETERPEAIEAGTVKLVGSDRQKILSLTEELLFNEAAYAAMANAVSPYGDGQAARRIVSALLEA
jgi:UDP-N-acetylglucosamine 2-epimerase